MTKDDLAALSAAEQKTDQPINDWLDARAEFHNALVNAYRTGDLVLIDREGMRERVAWRMWKEEAVRAAPNVARNRTFEAFQADTNPDERMRWIGLADAAIATIATILGD